MSIYSILKKTYLRNILLFIVAITSLQITSSHSYLLFHIFSEFIAIVIAFALFTITWNSRKIIDNQYLLLVGISAFFIGVLDLFHTITYKGMNIINSPIFYANQFWIATRLLEALTLFLGFAFIKTKLKLNTDLIFVIYSIISIVITLSILYWEIFPICFIEGAGQTAFKIYSEYLIIAILTGALFMLSKNKGHFDNSVYRLLFASIIFAIVSEFSFTLYISNYGISNQIGHYAKLITFILIYKANVETGFRKPASTLFKTIKDNEIRYKKLAEELAERNNKYTQLNNAYKLQNEHLSQLNQQLLESNQKLTESEFKLKESNITKDKFFSIIAHDLKNPFTLILGFSDLLRNNLQRYDHVTITKFVNNIHDAAKNTYNLLLNLLEWSRSQQGRIPFKPQKLSLNFIVQDCIEQTSNLSANKQIQISHNLTSDNIVFADTEMLRTVLRNLITNAIKYSHNGGTIFISAIHDDHFCEVSVKDNGIGMSLKTQQTLFKIEETSSLKGTAGESGTGLGLILSKEFIERHGGRIWVESQLNAGSQFKFTLPNI